MTTTRFLSRPGGRLAFDVEGDGPLVVCVPGMGDVRAEYRLLAPRLRAAGCAVATLDLRGHGESDATFDSYERQDAGEDVVALLAELAALGHAQPVHLVGASFGAAAAVWAATQVPQRIASLTLLGPFVRDLPTPLVQRLGLHLLLARPWGARAWAWWYGRLHTGQPPRDLDAYRAALRGSLADPARLRAVRAMARASSREIDPRLDDVRAPTLVVMGSADPDFPDPRAEAEAVAQRTSGEVLMADGAGHYPHVEQPDLVAEALVARRVARRSE